MPNSSAGYGLATPDDTRIEGTLDTAGTDFVVEAGAGSSSGATNVVLGHANNEVVLDFVGVTTSGGGGGADFKFDPNRIKGDFSTIGGGKGNTVETAVDEATIVCGANHTADTIYATIGGGSGNSVTGKHGTVAGGGGCDAEGSSAFVGGRTFNDCGLGRTHARDRVHARAQVFLALCLRLVVAITNYERGDNPGSTIITM